MFPIRMALATGAGFAAANTDAEYWALCGLGYVAQDAGPLPDVQQLPSQPSDATAADPAPLPDQPVKRGPGRPRKVPA